MRKPRIPVGPGEQRCPQCWIPKPHPEAFIGALGEVTKRCSACNEKYRHWTKKTPAEKLHGRDSRRGLRADGLARVLVIPASHNRKLGGIPATLTSPETCPPSCPHFGAGCFGEHHLMRLHWSRVERDGVDWVEFCRWVEALPPGQVWRHNEAGDLPGIGESLLEAHLRMLVRANRGRRGFSFTHKRVLADKHVAKLVQYANRNGFTVNVSVESLADADRVMEREIGPAAVIVPRGTARGLKTPLGRTVVLCPAETHRVTCATCQLCTNANRKSVVAFQAHGQDAALVELRLKKPARRAA